VLFGFFGAGVGTTVAVGGYPFAVGVVVVWNWSALDQFDSDAGLVSLDNTSHFR
jgi:hypothetical protein